MKKFMAVCLLAVALFFLADYLYFGVGLYIPYKQAPVTTMTVSGKNIYINQNGKKELFEIKGVNMGVGIPGHFATDYAIDKETYLRWFGYIQEMGANTVRVYTIQNDDFYEAVYEYNDQNPDPLYFLHGVWVNDYVQYSRLDAYDKQFLNTFIEDSKTLVDIIHGNKKVYLGKGAGSGFYNRDISPWVLGYILGVEWEDVTVAFTNDMQRENNQYQGTYMQTKPEATAFEAMLARVGDEMIQYETQKYGEQRLVAFSNWPTTDPFKYSEDISDYFYKIVQVDVENIQTTDAFVAGTFATYHIYPYYPDYLKYEEDTAQYVDPDGKLNTYYAYLKKINDHHTVPVVISEFGIPTSRGMAQKDTNTNRNQGGMSETAQGEALINSYYDIKNAGCAGAVIFSWQDEWFKRTWNTMHAIDLLKTPYWSDYQTNEQYFGLLSFDPGKEKSICYVDGDLSDWSEEDVVIEGEEFSLSMQYDEKFIYFLAYQKDFSKTKKLFIPLDITPKSGTYHSKREPLDFDRPVDFILSIDGEKNSRVYVQERYEVLRAMYYYETHQKDPYENPPAMDTTLFKPIHLILQTPSYSNSIFHNKLQRSETYETGLLTYGNANPNSASYNSLADFSFHGDFVEIKLPWQLLNFSNPSEMQIHDDYYKHYGIENLRIKEMYVGIGNGEEKISLVPFKLKGWRTRVTYHERLKPSYYAIQKIWNNEVSDTK